MKKLIIDPGCEVAHLGTVGNRYCLLSDFQGVGRDYDSPRTYWAIECDSCGRPISGRRIRVKVDHEATGTTTQGTGDIWVIMETIKRCDYEELEEGRALEE